MKFPPDEHSKYYAVWKRLCDDVWNRRIDGIYTYDVAEEYEIPAKVALEILHAIEKGECGDPRFVLVPFSNEAINPIMHIKIAGGAYWASGGGIGDGNTRERKSSGARGATGNDLIWFAF